MILIYKTLTKKEIKKDAKDTIPKLEKWFTDNPKRRVCNIQLWYGKMGKVRRGKVEEDMNKLAQEAMKK